MSVAGLAVGLAGTATAFTLWTRADQALAAVGDWLLSLLQQTSASDIVAIGTTWLALPLLVAASYWLLRGPLR